MVIEFYSDFTIFFQIGPFILATYGLFVGASCMTHTWITAAYLTALEEAKLLTVADELKAPLGAFSTLLIVVGYRLCSMFIEDTHELTKGNWLRALLRPGFLEAGGHTFLTVYGILVGLYLTYAMYASGVPLSVSRVLVPMCAIVDSLNVGYCTVMWLLSLGCVTYGCCWGMELPNHPWYATVYTSPGAKVLRIRPQLKGKPLYPHTTLRGFLFLKNGIILSILGSFFYVPGLFTFIYPILNSWDKNIYFSKRGDGGADLTGFCAEENFYMVAPAPKKAHCVVWAKPDQYFGWVAIGSVVYWLVTKQSYLTLNPLPDFMPALELPSFYQSMAAAFAVGCFSFGYHYDRMGCWLIPPGFKRLG